MELQQLKYFKTVAEIGKISEAADALFVSAPALSTSISRLEKELGIQLFDRTNNRIILNPQGQIFLKHINQVFFNLESAKQEMQQSLLQQGQHIFIASVNVAMWVNLITAFTSEFPQFTLSCSTLSLAKLAESGLPPQHNLLLASESDIPPSYADELDSAILFETRPSVMVHQDHPLAEKTTINLRDLTGERIFMPAAGQALHSRIIRLFEAYGLPLPADNAYSVLARRQMVSENLGISFFTMHAGFTPLPKIRYIPLEDPFGPWTTRLYWRKSKPLTRDEIVFKNFTEDFFRSLH